LQGQFRFHILLRGQAIVRLTRLARETQDKLPFPENVTVTVDIDPYQLLEQLFGARIALSLKKHYSLNT